MRNGDFLPWNGLALLYMFLSVVMETSRLMWSLIMNYTYGDYFDLVTVFAVLCTYESAEVVVIMNHT